MMKRGRYGVDRYAQDAKRRRLVAAQGPYTGIRGFQGPRTVRAPVRKYVNRTPGGQITAENHYFDTERTATALVANATSWTGTEYDPNTTAMLCLFAPVQGDDIQNRTGRKIFVKKIRISGVIDIAPQGGQIACDYPVTARIIVYMDKQTNGSQSQGEDLISSGAANDPLDMFQNITNLGRFKVYKDKKIMLTNPSQSVLAGPLIYQNGLTHNWKMNIRVNQWVNYNATNGGTVADVVDNSFHLICNVNSTTLAPYIAYKVRTVFTP